MFRRQIWSVLFLIIKGIFFSAPALATKWLRCSISIWGTRYNWQCVLNFNNFKLTYNTFRLTTSWVKWSRVRKLTVLVDGYPQNCPERLSRPSSHPRRNHCFMYIEVRTSHPLMGVGECWLRWLRASVSTRSHLPCQLHHNARYRMCLHVGSGLRLPLTRAQQIISDNIMVWFPFLSLHPSNCRFGILSSTNSVKLVSKSFLNVPL